MLPETRAWWKLVWSSPVASQWIEADLPNIHRLALLHDLTTRQFAIVADGPVPHIEERIEWQTDDERVVLIRFESPVQAQMLSEMRQIEDRLGLTPMARKRLQWELPEAGESGDGAAPKADELAARRKRFERFAG